MRARAPRRLCGKQRQGLVRGVGDHLLTLNATQQHARTHSATIRINTTRQHTAHAPTALLVPHRTLPRTPHIPPYHYSVMRPLSLLSVSSRKSTVCRTATIPRPSVTLTPHF